jgi:mono/diheme cytochrome c family protein
MLRKLLKILGVLAVLILIFGAVGWYKFFRVVPQPEFASEADWFKYGSFDGEAKTGLPYWIWMVLPRVFPDLLPGPGGYQSLGVVWEPGVELPVGFAKKTMGFPRVTQNCALCHTETYRLSEQEPNPTVVVGGPAHTFDVQKLIVFLTRAAGDPRFNADTLLPEIAQNVHLSFFDRLAYRFAIIPLTRRALQEQGRQFAWMSRARKPAWGPGRDDPFNLPKYFLAHLPEDHSLGQTDFVPAWRLDQRKGDGRLLNLGGESPAVRSVLVDSSVGFGPKPGRAYEEKIARLDRFLSSLAPPPWPYPTGEYAIQPALAAAGKAIYQEGCADCHEPTGHRCGRTVPLAEIGTDRERADTWSQAAADAVNAAIKQAGFTRPDLVKNDGYLAEPLDGLWLRAPYLHNGSVPNLRELLEPVENRSVVFYRGSDVLDPVNIGFVASGATAQRTGFKLDTRERGNGNQGHNYGTALSPAEKNALLEYLKTL